MLANSRTIFPLSPRGTVYPFRLSCAIISRFWLPVYHIFTLNFRLHAPAYHRRRVKESGIRVTTGKGEWIR
ncbi:hypothetical protein EBL_c36540 [Shimwellia blattae DSM 4481 = NBRC 105725]|uniref:Uncharacterized protein n=1 Tax=Shimwellia blattae (strain ATCC 29907 / DSM 4481 / JCM 1650 / NBRC 105725 / CDC 9005-74) TaxID=630626 RepID=I2BDV1_SHIBC|nr:hypothetical protein EBL_c36540 [Shimwellia blattae DSM 4481 = NBRC 105725]